MAIKVSEKRIDAISGFASGHAWFAGSGRKGRMWTNEKRDVDTGELDP